MEFKTFIIAILTTLPVATMIIKFLGGEPLNLLLPTHIWPLGYNITIQFIFNENNGDFDLNFKGDVVIRVRSMKATNLLVLHSKDLEYTMKEYWPEGGKHLRRKLHKFRYDRKTDRMIFNLDQLMQPHKVYYLHFKYFGLIRNKSQGVFKKKYENSDKWIVGTQFQPADARTAFPSFDEPRFKSAFALRIVRPSHMKAYSNTRRRCSKIRENYTTDIFETTPKMPTYTVAFLIAPFEERTDGSFSVLSLPEHYPKTDFSFKIGKKLLEVLGEYLGMSYYKMGIDKNHLAPIPDLNFVGMENWGLVLALPRNIVYDESTDTNHNKMNIIGLIAHELAHMWFGNLVTCEWWNYIWLNEGFATYFRFFGPAMINDSDSVEFKKLQMNEIMWEELFIIKEFLPSLLFDDSKQDSLNFVTKDVSRYGIFNKRIYGKGAVLIHVVRQIIGETNFRNSLGEYLRTYKYETVKPINLLNIWEKYCPPWLQDGLSRVFHSLTEQAGYPLIKVHVAADGRSFDVLQEVYQENVINKTFNIDSDNQLLFTVPINYATNLNSNFSDTSPAFFLSEKNETIKLSNNSSIKWIIVNKKASGYYRVNYNDNNWQGIAEALWAPNWSGIHKINRAQIADDICHFYCADLINTDLVLKVLSYLSSEIEYLPWNSAINGLKRIKYKLVIEFKDLRSYLRDLTIKVYEYLGFSPRSNDTIFDIYNREQILPMACKYENPSCIVEANYYFHKEEELRELSNASRFIVYCTVVRMEDKGAYDILFNSYHDPNSNEDKKILIKALGCLRNPLMVEQHYESILSEEVEKADKVDALKSLYSENDENAYRIYRLLMRDYEKILKIFDIEEDAIAKILSELVLHFTEDYQIEDWEDFCRRNDKIHSGHASRILQNALHALREGSKCDSYSSKMSL